MQLFVTSALSATPSSPTPSSPSRPAHERSFQAPSNEVAEAPSVSSGRGPSAREAPAPAPASTSTGAPYSPIADPNVQPVRRSGGLYTSSGLERGAERVGDTVLAIRRNCDADCCEKLCLGTRDCFSFTANSSDSKCYLVGGLAPCARAQAGATAGVLFNADFDVYPAPQSGVGFRDLPSLATWSCPNYPGEEGATWCLADCVQVRVRVRGNPRHSSPSLMRKTCVTDVLLLFLMIHDQCETSS